VVKVQQTSTKTQHNNWDTYKFIATPNILMGPKATNKISISAYISLDLCETKKLTVFNYKTKPSCPTTYNKFCHKK